jgi:hypothetical protein
VVAIAGKYRAGKSFLLNHLIGKVGCFNVGDTTNACTKGLWIWNKTFPVKMGVKDINVIIIDTEGLGDTDNGVNHDVRIFMFALLISSRFIFNCWRAIDSDMIQQISLVTQMTKNIRLSNNHEHSRPEEMEPDAYKQLFPALTVLIRDFELQNRDDNGKP